MSQRTNPIALVLSLVLAAVLFADEKQDLVKLQGTWNTKKGPVKDMVMTIDGNKFSLKSEGQEFKGTFVIDSSKTPKTMDLTVTGGEGVELSEYKGKTSKAIYELDGETFKWCANEPGKDGRPTKFDKDDGADIDALLVVFEREKH